MKQNQVDLLSPSTQLDVAHLQHYLADQGLFRFTRHTLNLILIPLLILACIGVGFVLVWAEHILVPFVISIFFTYLLRPVVDFLNRPFARTLWTKHPFTIGMPTNRSSIGMSSTPSNINNNSNEPTSTCGLGLSMRSASPQYGSIPLLGEVDSEADSSLDLKSQSKLERSDTTNRSELEVLDLEPNSSVPSAITPKKRAAASAAKSEYDVNLMITGEIDDISNDEDFTQVQREPDVGGSVNDDDDSHNGKSKRNKRVSTRSDGIYKVADRFGIRNMGLKDIGCPRMISVCLAIVLSVALVTGLVIFFVDAIQQFEQHNWKRYEDRAVELAAKFFDFLKRNFDIDGSKMFDQLMNDIKVYQITTSLVVLMMDALGYTFIVFLFVLYMLFEDSSPTTLANPGESASLFGAQAKRSTDSHLLAVNLRKQIDLQIQRYIVIKTLISAFVGILVYLILGPLLDVKLAHAFGVITFLANYIPNVGAIVATLLPIPILVLDSDQTSLSMILAVLLPVSVHTIVGNFVEPKVFGDTMELHAVVVLLSLSFWFAVWGIPGAILAVPIMAVLRIIVSNIDHPYARVSLRLLEGKLPGSTEFHEGDTD